MGGQPGKPKPIGNPPIRYEPQRPPIEEPPKPIPPPPVERPPLPVAVLISMAWTARPIATPAADNSAIAPQIKAIRRAGKVRATSNRRSEAVSVRCAGSVYLMPCPPPPPP
jgi:hypothetical protein